MRGTPTPIPCPSASGCRRLTRRRPPARPCTTRPASSQGPCATAGKTVPLPCVSTAFVCLCLVFLLPSWLRHYLCLVFTLPSWLMHCVFCLFHCHSWLLHRLCLVFLLPFVAKTLPYLSVLQGAWRRCRRLPVQHASCPRRSAHGPFTAVTVFHCVGPTAPCESLASTVWRCMKFSAGAPGRLRHNGQRTRAGASLTTSCQPHPCRMAHGAHP